MRQDLGADESAGEDMIEKRYHDVGTLDRTGPAVTLRRRVRSA